MQNCVPYWSRKISVSFFIKVKKSKDLKKKKKKVNTTEPYFCSVIAVIDTNYYYKNVHCTAVFCNSFYILSIIKK